jgi:hemolysin activation/secretion protein
LLAAVPSVAAAQSAPIAPPSRSEIERAPATRQQPRARLSVEGGVERAPCALDDPAYQAIKIKLTAANFKHLGPVAASELKASYAEFLGTEQPISVVCRIRDAAATHLRSLGYIAAVQVPAQRIENGAVDFEVLYARLTQVRVVGTPGRSEKVVQAYLSRLADG